MDLVGDGIERPYSAFKRTFLLFYLLLAIFTFYGCLPPQGQDYKFQTQNTVVSKSETDLKKSSLIDQAEVWHPAIGATWQWQLSNLPVDQSHEVDVYDIDLFDYDASLVADLYAKARKVVCYLSEGATIQCHP